MGRKLGEIEGMGGEGGDCEAEVKMKIGGVECLGKWWVKLMVRVCSLRLHRAAARRHPE